MAVELPTIPVVLGTAAVDAINPCAIGVLVILVATLVSLHEDKKKLLAIGSIYIGSVFLTYLLAGFGLLYFIQTFNIGPWLSWVVGIIVIIMGIIEIKDYFWYGKGISLSISKGNAKRILKYIENVSIPGSIFLGIFVAAVELPCTGGPYLAITYLLAQAGFSLQVFLLLALYNFIFVLPLIIILGLVYFGVSADKIKNWKTDNRKYMRLAMGIVLIALGVVLILWANGIIGLKY